MRGQTQVLYGSLITMILYENEIEIPDDLETWMGIVIDEVVTNNPVYGKPYTKKEIPRPILEPNNTKFVIQLTIENLTPNFTRISSRTISQRALSISKIMKAKHRKKPFINLNKAKGKKPAIDIGIKSLDFEPDDE